MKTKQLPETEQVEAPVVEDVPVEEEVGEVEEKSEPYGAQVLRRLHNDSSILMKEYDDMGGPLEHSEIKGHLQGHLQGIEKHLTAIEKMFKRHYKDLPPLDGGMDVKDEEVEEADSSEEELPTPEEALEGMQTKDGLGEPEPVDEEVVDEEAVAVERKSLRGKYRRKQLNGIKAAPSHWPPKVGDWVSLHDEVHSGKVISIRGNELQISLRGSEQPQWYDISDIADYSSSMYSKDFASDESVEPAVNGVKALCPACGKDPCVCPGKKAFPKLKGKADGLRIKALTGYAAVDYTKGDTYDEVRHGPIRSSESQARQDAKEGTYAGVRYVHTDGHLYVDKPEKSLSSKGHRDLVKIKAFLKQLGDEQEFGDEHKLKAYHFHKQLEETLPDELGEVDEKQGPLAAIPAIAGAVSGAMKAEPGTPEWEEEESLEPEHKAWHKAEPTEEDLVLEETSKYLKALAFCKDFGDPHRNAAKAIYKQLEELTKGLFDVFAPGESELGGGTETIAEKVVAETEAEAIQQIRAKFPELSSAALFAKPHQGGGGRRYRRKAEPDTLEEDDTLPGPGEMGEKDLEDDEEEVKTINRIKAAFTKQHQATAALTKKLAVLNGKF